MAEEKKVKKERFNPLIQDQYPFGEVASALQKEIRRSKEYEACYWAYLFHTAGFGEYLWRRLSIICAEDIGNGSPEVHILLNSLRQSWERLHKKIRYHTNDKFLFVIQAVLFMCRAKKSRENDSLANLLDENWQSGQRLEIEEYCLDSHCDRGRKVYGKFGDMDDGKEKLRLDKWFSEWSKITNIAYKDKWEEQIKEIWYRKAKEGAKKSV